MITVKIPSDFVNERRYAVDVVFSEFLGQEYRLARTGGDAYEIQLPNGNKLRMPDVFFSGARTDWLGSRSMPKQPLRVWRALNSGLETCLVRTKLPLLFASSECSELLIRQNSFGTELELDVIGSAFFMLTRYEELVTDRRDGHARVMSADSTAVQSGFLDRPIIDEYVEILWFCLKLVDPSLRRYPREYRVIPTHDLDRPFAVRDVRHFSRVLLSHIFHMRGPTAVGQWIKYGARRLFAPSHDVFFRGMQRALDVSERNGLRSKINVMGALWGPRDYGYDPGYRHIRQLLTGAMQRGHEIGFHPGYRTPGAPKILGWEKKRVEQALGVTLYSGRQHYLRADWRGMWREWDRLGMRFDSSLGYADCSGFRCGVCRPYPVYDLENRQPLGLREMPLILMDGTLKAPFNEALTPDQGLEKAIWLSDICKQYRGDFVILWHNSSFSGEWHPWGRVYEELIRQATAGG